MNGYAWIEYGANNIGLHNYTAKLIDPAAIVTYSADLSSQISGYARAKQSVVFKPGFKFKATSDKSYFSAKPLTARQSAKMLVLQPGAEGKDACLSSYAPSTNWGNYEGMLADAWTINSVPITRRSLIDFDLSSIPADAVITSATLTFYHNPLAKAGINQNGLHSSHTSSNASQLVKITQAWEEGTVTWNNAPTTGSVVATLAQSTSGTQDYVVDVLSYIKDKRAYPTSNFGLMLKLQNETQYALMNFASSDNIDAANHPKLEIAYISATALKSDRGGEVEESFIEPASVASQLEAAIYPNPAASAGEVTISLNQQIEKGEISIFNALGKIVSTQPMSGNVEQVKLGQSTPGIYFVRITTEKGSCVGRLEVK